VAERIRNNASTCTTRIAPSTLAVPADAGLLTACANTQGQVSMQGRHCATAAVACHAPAALSTLPLKRHTPQQRYGSTLASQLLVRGQCEQACLRVGSAERLRLNRKGSWPEASGGGSAVTWPAAKRCYAVGLRCWLLSQPMMLQFG